MNPMTLSQVQPAEQKQTGGPPRLLDEVRLLFRQLAELYTEARSRWFHNLSIGLVQWLEGYLQTYSERNTSRVSSTLLTSYL